MAIKGVVSFSETSLSNLTKNINNFCKEYVVSDVSYSVTEGYQKGIYLHNALVSHSGKRENQGAKEFLEHVDSVRNN